MPIFLLALFFSTIGLVMPEEAVAEVPVQTSTRAVPDNNLAYPVKVVLQGSQGSGFFLNAAAATYFVTAKHVLYNPATGKPHSNDLTLEAFSANPAEKLSNILQIDLRAAEAAGHLKAHPSQDVAIIKLGAVSNINGSEQLNFFQGVILKQSAPSGIVGVDANATVKQFDNVQISNDVYIFGYPNSIGLQSIPQLDQTRPLLRKGIVAGKNEILKTIILDCGVFSGNSGGLVVEVENEVFQRRFKVIGIVAQFIPFDNSRFGISNSTLLNSGYSVVVPMVYYRNLELAHFR